MNIKKDVERRKFQTVSDDITIMFMNDFNFIEISQTSVMHSKAQAISALIILDRKKANNDYYQES